MYITDVVVVIVAVARCLYSRCHSYMIVFAHWLDADFTSHAKCLAVTKLSRSSSSETTPAAVLNAVIDGWSLDRHNLQITVSASDAQYQDITSKVVVIVVVVVIVLVVVLVVIVRSPSAL